MIYLDNAATTKPCEEAIEAAAKCMRSCFGNPSSLHKMGIEAEKIITSAKKTILNRLNKEGEIFFTSGATESNNLAIFGTAQALKRRGNRIVTTAIEHPSVAEPMKILAGRGFEIISIKPSEYESPQLFEDALIDAVNEKTILLSFMSVNNETGYITDSNRIYKAVKRKYPTCVIHVDGVQGFCKVPISADLISLSSHKIHGIKGVGALYKAKSTRLLPIVYGGGQQLGLRSGTEPVDLIAAFDAAIKAYPENFTLFSELRHKLMLLLEQLDGIIVNSKNSVDNIVNFSVIGIRSEIMLHFLEEKGIYVSSGSACSKGKISPVLEALGVSAQNADSAVRVSFCRNNTANELEILTEALSEGIKRFKR